LGLGELMCERALGIFRVHEPPGEMTVAPSLQGVVQKKHEILEVG